MSPCSYRRKTQHSETSFDVWVHSILCVFSILSIVIGQVVNGFKLRVGLDELLGRNSLL